MKNRHLIILLSLLVLLCGTLAAHGVEGRPPAAGLAGVTVDFKDIELVDLIRAISELTGRNFIYDDNVRGKATIISSQPISRDEAYQVFLSVLNVKGFTVVPSGGFDKIVPTVTARESNLPTVQAEGDPARGEQYVTRLIPLEHVKAGEVATTVLAPLVAKTGNVVAYAPTNTLIITDSAANIERMAQILHRLDAGTAADTLEILPLAHVSAEEMAKLVDQFIGQKTFTDTGRRGGAAAEGGAADAARVIPFRTANALVVLAGKDDMATIRTLVARLDQPASGHRASIHVYFLEHADAETLARTLNEILTGFRKSDRSQDGGGGRAVQVQGQLADSLQSVSITPDKPTNSLVISCIPEEYQVVREIVQQLDIKRKQVYVEALILELSMDATEKLGASLQGAVDLGSDSALFGRTGLNTDNVKIDAENPLASAINGIMLGGIFNPITIAGPDGTEITVPALSALIDLSKTDSGINILSAPRLLTSDNEEAEIIVGSNVPIITSRLTNAVGAATDTSTGLATSVAVERKDVALTLRFTPQITSAGDLVRLSVYQEITDVAEASSNVGNPEQVGPTFTKRLIRNTVVPKNHQTIVLGGLIGTNVSERVTKVPLLGDVPVLGWLFKSKSTVASKTNLLVFITPHILASEEDVSAVTRKARDAMNDFRDKVKPSPQQQQELIDGLITPSPSALLPGSPASQ
ncbi:MAG: type II secretion system secretin GspD [Thermodesulfobacteriota bacterium]